MDRAASDQRHGFQPESDGFRPASDGFRPASDGKSLAPIGTDRGFVSSDDLTLLLPSEADLST